MEETPEAYKVIENPLTSQEPTIIPKAQLEEQVKSKISLMPEGLLDKLTPEEILDLTAYIKAGGDEKNPLFTGGHGHAGHNHGGGHQHCIERRVPRIGGSETRRRLRRRGAVG